MALRFPVNIRLGSFVLRAASRIAGASIACLVVGCQPGVPMDAAGEVSDGTTTETLAPDVVPADMGMPVDVADTTDITTDVAMDSPPTDVSDVVDVVDATDASDAAVLRCPTFPAMPAMRTGAVCDTANLIDLNAAGAPDRTYLGWMNAPLRADGEILLGCGFRGLPDSANRQLVHTYRMRSSSRLRASTDHLGTYCGPEGVTDTYVGIYRACTPGGPASNNLGCTDTNVYLTAGPSTTLSLETIPAGTTVYVVVGTVARDGNPESTGPYELSVEEVRDPRLGDPCMPEAEASATLPDQCPSGSTCVAPNPYSQLGRCVADGTAPLARCRPVAGADGGVPDASTDAGSATTECDVGLACYASTSVTRTCYNARTIGAACNFDTDRCEHSNPFRCAANDPSDALAGRCMLYHTAAGSPCAGSTNMCPGSLECSGTAADSSCRATMTLGQPCDPAARSSICASGASCAPNTTGAFVCQSDGTSAGTACRGTAPRCDGSLACSVSAGEGRCMATLAAGAMACDPRFGTQRCPSGTVCLATGYRTGLCTTPVDEPMAANNHPSLAAVFAAPLAVRGALPTGADVDCYAVMIPSGGGSLRVEVNDGAASCPQGEDPMITIHGPDGRVIDGADDHYGSLCPIRDGAWTGSPLHALPAGRYTACVRSWFGASPIGRYVLNMSVSAP